MLRRELHLVLVSAFNRQQSDPRDGRIFELFAEFDFLFVKASEVVASGVLNRWMKWREGLHNDFAFHVAAPGTSCHLGQQLKCPFARAEVWLVQAKVRVDNANERHVREMESLGDHLC